MSVYATLAQEPWCFDPDRIARLTDFQVHHLYHAPALERARRVRGGAPPAAADPFAGGLPPRGEFVAAMLAADGRTAGHWNAEYDRLEAESRAAADGHPRAGA